MDDLERRIRAARPVSGHRDLPLTDRAKRELADLVLADVETSPPARYPRPRAVWHWALGAAVVVVALAVSLPLSTTTPVRAHAATPPLLTVTPLPGTAQERLHALGTLAAAQPVSSDARKAIQISVEAWTLSTDDDGVSRSSAVVPEHYERTRLPDGTLTQVVTAGIPIGPAPSVGPTPGTVLQRETWPRGQDAYLFTTSAPVDPKRVAAFLARPDEAALPLSASDAIEKIGSLLLEQSLNPAQNAAILAALADLPDLSLAGTTTDRLGRAGIMFSGSPSVRPGYSGYVEHIVIDPNTGRILSVECTYNGTDRTDIPSPSVVDYFAWH